MGDGEIQEGQVYEMVNFADKYRLDNLIVFIDYNKIQLSGKLDTIMDIDFRALFGHWDIHEIDGHSVDQIITTLQKCDAQKGKAHVIFGHTIM